MQSFLLFSRENLRPSETARWVFFLHAKPRASGSVLGRGSLPLQHYPEAVCLSLPKVEDDISIVTYLEDSLTYPLREI